MVEYQIGGWELEFKLFVMHVIKDHPIVYSLYFDYVIPM